MRIWPVVVLVIITPSDVVGQNRFPPDTLRNLKVLPASMPVPQVIAMMRGFTTALGVRCTYCHVGEENQPLDRYDFAADDRRPKLVAREMIRMVADINQRTLASLPNRPAPGVDVTCATCHRGVTRPMAIGDVLAQAVAAGGQDSAVGAYRALRTRYYGTAAYDFSEQPLNDIALTLAGRTRQYDAALAMMSLGAEFFPTSADVQAITGEVYRMKGDTTAAVQAYRAALQRNPQHPVASRRLAEIGPRP